MSIKFNIVKRGKPGDSEAPKNITSPFNPRAG